MRRAERGAVLLEAIVALTILGSAGLALAAIMSQSVEAVRSAVRAERQIVEASAALEAIALWSRTDLERHSGDRPYGDWRLAIGRAGPVLFDVALRDSTTGAVILATTLYRRSERGR